MGGVKCKDFGMVQTPQFLKRNFFSEFLIFFEIEILNFEKLKDGLVGVYVL